jgi:hypothetical protein
VQTLNGSELPDVSGSVVCAKNIDDITQEDLDKIDAILHPMHFEVPIIGVTVPFAEGPEVEVGSCLAESDVSGSSAPVYSPVVCDDDEAAWEIVAETPPDAACADEATAVTTKQQESDLLCLVEVD